MPKLDPHPVFPGIAGPVLTVVLDGVGFVDSAEGNAVRAAHTPVLDRLWTQHPHTLLRAHGTAVGMPSDGDMGNSEVGHNAMGAGQVFAQGAALVNDASASGRLFEGDAWQEIVGGARDRGGTLHLIGLVSDGNVHSHVDHLRALIERAREDGVSRVRVLAGSLHVGPSWTELLGSQRFEPGRFEGRPVAVAVYRLYDHVEVSAPLT